MKTQVDDAERLARAWRRDLTAVIHAFAGWGDEQDKKALGRFYRTWEKLCATDIDMAAGIHHAMSEITGMMARYGAQDSPANYHERQMSEMMGMVELGRTRNPGVMVTTLGELYGLGEKAIADDIEKLTGGES